MILGNSIYWLILIAVLIFVEILTLRFTTIWFAIGALVAFVVSLLFDNLFFEIFLFFAVSVAFLSFIRPLVMIYHKSKKLQVNYEEIIGKYAFVTAAIDNRISKGQVEISGQEWSARSLEGDSIESGTKVKIYGISEKKLIVKKVDN
ncbi:MAG TPA: NfeD family protein [Mobilitalea sp.]|nr:NfeD family protein [Mobilitalea sp.]